MMHMTFYWGKKVTLLFDSWRTETWTAYSITLLAVFLFSSFYQYMENRRLRFKSISLSPPPPPSRAAFGSVETPFLFSSLPRRMSVARFAVAVLFGVNSAIGYLLMLAVMSYNGGVFVVVILGLMVGNLAFRSGGVEEFITVENPCACS